MEMFHFQFLEYTSYGFHENIADLKFYWKQSYINVSFTSPTPAFVLF